MSYYDGLKVNQKRGNKVGRLGGGGGGGGPLAKGRWADAT